jgi:hypothetical protein
LNGGFQVFECIELRSDNPVIKEKGSGPVLKRHFQIELMILFRLYTIDTKNSQVCDDVFLNPPPGWIYCCPGIRPS